MSARLKRIKRAAGARFIVSLADTVAADGELRLFSELLPAGFIFFRRNIESPDSLRSLTGSLRKRIRDAVVYSIDEEGGRVRRLPDGPYSLPSAAQLGTLAEDEQIRRVTMLAEVLSGAGINLDFAPVVDLGDGSSDGIVGDRAFSSDSGVVATRAGLFLRCLLSRGVHGVLKHFPGHGTTAVDSHHKLPVIDRDLSAVRREDMHPYRKRAADASFVMPGHLVLPAVDTLPASLSPVWHRILRDEIGFTGITITDDIEMGALDTYTTEKKNELFRNAGYDIMTICSGNRDTITAHWEEMVRHLETDHRELEKSETLRRQCEREMGKRTTFR